MRLKHWKKRVKEIREFNKRTRVYSTRGEEHFNFYEQQIRQEKYRDPLELDPLLLIRYNRFLPPLDTQDVIRESTPSTE
jgi:hypothetical protein